MNGIECQIKTLDCLLLFFLTLYDQNYVDALKPHPYVYGELSFQVGPAYQPQCSPIETQRASARSGTNVERCGSGSQPAFQFILKVCAWVQVWALCKPVKFFHTRLCKSFLNGPALHTGTLLCWNRNQMVSKLVDAHISLGCP